MHSHLKSIAAYIATTSLALAGCSTTHLSQNQSSPESASPAVIQFVQRALKAMDDGIYAQGPEWREVRKRAETETRGARTIAETLPSLRTALAVAGGPHSHLRTKAEDDLYNAQLLNLPATSSSTPSRQQADAPTPLQGPLPTATHSEGVTILTVPPIILRGYSSEELPIRQGYVDAADSGIETNRTKTTCGWIVDFRHNGGGQSFPMLSAIKPFLSAGTVVDSVRRGASVDPVSLTAARQLKVNSDYFPIDAPPRSRIDMPVAVLQDKLTGSAAEYALLALSGEKNVRTFGQATSGMTTGLSGYDLGEKDIVLAVAVSVMRDRSGKTYGTPISPQDSTLPGREADAATQWLRSQCHQQ